MHEQWNEQFVVRIAIIVGLTVAASRAVHVEGVRMTMVIVRHGAVLITACHTRDGNGFLRSKRIAQMRADGRAGARQQQQRERAERQQQRMVAMKTRHEK